jgi:2-phospho-L-lactate guanylyltransferase
MSWTAVVPFKPAGERKTRLGDTLPVDQREALAEQLFGHVLAVLAAEARIGTVLVLSQVRPSRWSGPWRADGGRGLNAELQAARTDVAGAMLVLHSDLPLLIAANVAQMIDAGEAAGFAIAPDRHGTGTNAIAVADARPFTFSFGPDSYRLHRRQIAGHWQVVPAPGLAIDIDTPVDLALAVARGFCPAL